MTNPVSPFYPPLSFSLAPSPMLRGNTKMLRMRLLDWGQCQVLPPGLKVVKDKSMIVFMPLRNHEMSKRKACSSPQMGLAPPSSQPPSLYPRPWCSLRPECCSHLPPQHAVVPLRSGLIPRHFCVFADLYNDWYLLTFLSDTFSNHNNFLVLKWFHSVFICNNI